MGPTILTLHFYFLKTWEKTFKRKMKLSFVTLFLAADAGAAARKEKNALAAAQRKAANAVLAQIAAQKAEAKTLAKEAPKDAVGGVVVGGIQARSGALFEDDVSEGQRGPRKSPWTPCGEGSSVSDAEPQWQIQGSNDRRIRLCHRLQRHLQLRRTDVDRRWRVLSQVPKLKFEQNQKQTLFKTTLRLSCADNP